MGQVKLKKNIKQNTRRIPTSGQAKQSARPKRHIFYNKGEVVVTRSQVDDATWDRTVMQLMEEYDEAWTRLADM
jgi:hypothetical protein